MTTLSSILDNTLGKIRGGKSVEEALAILDGKLINKERSPDHWNNFKGKFETQVAKFSNEDEDDVVHLDKKAKQSKEVLMAAAWESYQASRKSMGKKLRKKALKYQCGGNETGAYQLLQQSVEVYPCDSLSRLKLAEKQRDGGNLEEFERSLRDCITVTTLTAVSEKEVKAGWTALSHLALLLCQQGRDDEARDCLTLLGFQYRLSRCLLHYNLPNENREVVAPDSSGVVVLDNALPPHLLTAAYSAFSPSSPFWMEHKYFDPCTGYFSYVMPLKQPGIKNGRTCLMDKIVETSRDLAAKKFPQVATCEKAEWWAHCRCHASGHQLHFDSAFEVGIYFHSLILSLSL
jgi:hypothetical protein